jgi:hypothetical protein
VPAAAPWPGSAGCADGAGGVCASPHRSGNPQATIPVTTPTTPPAPPTNSRRFTIITLAPGPAGRSKAIVG